MFVFIFLRVGACSSLHPRHPVLTSLQSACALWLQLFASLIPWRQTPYFTQLCPCSVQHTACQVVGCSELVFLLSTKICWPPTIWPGTLPAVEHWRDLRSCWQSSRGDRHEIDTGLKWSEDEGEIVPKVQGDPPQRGWSGSVFLRNWFLKWELTIKGITLAKIIKNVAGEGTASSKKHFMPMGSQKISWSLGREKRETSAATLEVDLIRLVNTGVLHTENNGLPKRVLRRRKNWLG